MRCTLQRPTFDKTNVRRSNRLGKKPAIPAVERVQWNMCRKLGHTTDELTPSEEVLRKFITTFHGPLPAHVIDAMHVSNLQPRRRKLRTSQWGPPPPRRDISGRLGPPWRGGLMLLPSLEKKGSSETEHIQSQKVNAPDVYNWDFSPLDRSNDLAALCCYIEQEWDIILKGIECSLA